MKKNILFPIIIVMLSITIVNGAVVETNSSTGVDTNSATLTGNLTNFTGTNASCWFVYDWVSHSSTTEPWNVYSLKTDNQTKTSNGTFTASLEGIKDAMFAEKTFYFRACAQDSTNCSCGKEFNFTLTAVPALASRNFSSHFDELIESRFNLTLMAQVIPKTYTDIMVGEIGEYIFYGLVFGIIFLAFWIRSEDVLIPGIAGMILGGILIAYIPPEWQKLSQSLLVISIFATIYSIIKGRR